MPDDTVGRPVVATKMFVAALCPTTPSGQFVDVGPNLCTIENPVGKIMMGVAIYVPPMDGSNQATPILVFNAREALAFAEEMIAVARRVGGEG